jgi:hypothetical protein
LAPVESISPYPGTHYGDPARPVNLASLKPADMRLKCAVSRSCPTYEVENGGISGIAVNKVTG